MKAALAEDPWVPVTLPKGGPGDLGFTLPIVQIRRWGREFAEAGLREAGGLAELHPRASFVTFRDVPQEWVAWGRAGAGEGRDARFLGPAGGPHAAGCPGSARRVETSGGTRPAGLARRSRFKALGPPPARGRGLPGHAPVRPRPPAARARWLRGSRTVL